MSYVDEVLDRVIRENPNEPEFHQAVKEVLNSLRPVVDANEEKFRRDALLERLVNPERQLKFRVPWVDDKGQVQVNTGYRVQYSSAIGPYKGGIRLHHGSIHPEGSEHLVEYQKVYALVIHYKSAGFHACHILPFRFFAFTQLSGYGAYKLLMSLYITNTIKSSKQHIPRK